MIRRRSSPAVMGLQAPPPRPTAVGALWLACVLALPVGLILGLVEILWRVLR